MPNHILNIYTVVIGVVLMCNGIAGCAASDSNNTESETEYEAKALFNAECDSVEDADSSDIRVVCVYADVVVIDDDEPIDENKVYNYGDQMPKFPGGDVALLKWVSEHIQYPAAAKEKGIQGRVYVQLVVKSTGDIGEVKILHGKDPDLDKEALRVAKSLPNFIPGKLKGQDVNSWYTLPVIFRLPGV